MSEPLSWELPARELGHALCLLALTVLRPPLSPSPLTMSGLQAMKLAKKYAMTNEDVMGLVNQFK